ncbi:hypothetical protein D4Q85_00660 [bacterium]|nr:MAG: hypothetical protein D4Q85_00660 [bacterium]
MTNDLPDYSRYSTIVGHDVDGNPVVVLTDASGRMIGIFTGEDPEGDLQTIAVDAAHRMKAAMYGSEGVVLATDAAGNILGILQGDYAGELKTLAVDTEGRLQAVLTDPEDVFGNPSYLGAAELAARLGCPSRYMRTGKIFFMDSFDTNQLNWSQYCSDANSYAVLSSEESLLGDQSVKLVTYANEGDYAGIERYFALPFVTQSVGLELAWRPTNALGELNVLWEISNGTTWEYLFGFRFNMPTSTLGQYNPLGSDWLTGYSLAQQAYLFHHFKIIINLDTKYYHSFYLDKNHIDISSSGGEPKMGGTNPYQSVVRIWEETQSDDACTSYIDDIILTAEEIS